MVLEVEQEKIEGLLTDAIITLCRNGITFCTELDIKAQVVLTADQGEPFCVNLESTLCREIPGDGETPEPKRTKVEESLHASLLNMKQEVPDPNYQHDDMEDLEEDSITERFSETPDIPETVETPKVSSRTTPGKRGRPRKRKRAITRKPAKKEKLTLRIVKPDPDTTDNIDLGEDPEPDPEEDTSDAYHSDPDFTAETSVKSKANKSMSSVLDHMTKSTPSEEELIVWMEELQCFKCGKCEYTSEQKSVVKRHTKIHFQTKLVCFYCDEEFDDKFKRRSHADQMHFGEKPECKVCKKRFSTLASLKIHQNNIHDGKKSRMKLRSCEFCDYKSRHYGNLLRHMRCNHGKQDLSCIFCHKEFSDKLLLKTHIQEEHEDETVSCSLCKRDFKTPAGLHNHMKVDHGDGLGAEDSYKCAGCNYSTFSQAKLDKHLKKNTGKNLDCPWCDKKNICKIELKNHLEEAHPAEAKRKPCEFCNKVFFSKNGLYAHKKIFHTGEEDPAKRNVFTCHTCGKSFPIYDYLKRHMRSHDPTYEPYECPKCHKRFKYHRNCKTHKEGCMNENGYQCHQCGKTLKNEYCLREHVRNMHTDEKKDAYPCRNCGMSFNYSGSRSKHEKSCQEIYIPSHIANPQQVPNTQGIIEVAPPSTVVVEVGTLPPPVGQEDYRYITGSEVDIAAYTTVLPQFSGQVHVHTSLPQEHT